MGPGELAGRAAAAVLRVRLAPLGAHGRPLPLSSGEVVRIVLLSAWKAALARCTESDERRGTAIRLLTLSRRLYDGSKRVIFRRVRPIGTRLPVLGHDHHALSIGVPVAELLALVNTYATGRSGASLQVRTVTGDNRLNRHNSSRSAL